jgi:hypothetical protein
MVRFDEFIVRHGEVAAQAKVENMERFEGAQSDKHLSLEERWQRLIQSGADQRHAA